MNRSWHIFVVGVGGLAAWAFFSSCLFDARYQAPTILFLGNSITWDDVQPAYGWNNKNGMAATVPDSDYVHQTVTKLGERGIRAHIEYGHRDCEICGGPVMEFLPNVAADLEKTHPHWVVVQLGENYNQTEIESGKMYVEYLQLLLALRKGGSFPIFCTSDWTDTTLSAIRTATILKTLQGIPNIYLVDITSVSKDPANFGDSVLFPDPSVHWHPGNRGMAAIATILSDSIAAHP